MRSKDLSIFNGPVYKLYIALCVMISSFLMQSCNNAGHKSGSVLSYSPDNPLIRYTGRIDFSDVRHPRFWQPGVYVEWAFNGTDCEVIMEDEVLWGNSHNYIEVVVDGKQQRLQMKGSRDTIVIAKGLSESTHQVLLCKNTEAGIGFLSVAGIRCNKLVALPPAMNRKIELIGNSITSGMGSDQTEVPCDKGAWYDQHNAYRSYGAITARALKAQYHLSSVSGIGLMRSCCDMKVIMPEVFDKVNMRGDSISWNFDRYQPDVVTVCLGQNDGIQDSSQFCTNYIRFADDLRRRYPSATLVFLSSPMANDTLGPVMKKYLSAITDEMKKKDERVYCYFFSRRYSSGCGEHPSLEDHQQIASELTAFLRRIMKWS